MSQTNSAAVNEEPTEKTTWDELRTVIQGRWSELTGEDFDKLKGQVNRLVTLVQERYGISADDAKRQVSEFEQTLEERGQRLYKAASDTVGSRYRTARDGVSEFTQDVRNFGFGTTLVDLVRHYPVATIATSFLLGALVAGGTVRSRRRRWY